MKKKIEPIDMEQDLRFRPEFLSPQFKVIVDKINQLVEAINQKERELSATKKEG